MARLGLTQLTLATLVLLSISAVVIFVMANTDFCGSVFETQMDHVLVGHVISVATVADEFECNLKCLGNNSCKSFNIHPTGNSAKCICELNNKTRHMKPGHFKRKKGSIYYGSVQVSCLDGSHVYNTKQTKKRKCHPGYAGKRCTVIKGLHPKYPAHSCKDIRDKGGIDQNGEYWIDPENSGNPLKVYCDMTTHGGGWLLIFNIVIGDDPPISLGIEKSYLGISNYSNNNMVLLTTALKELRTHLPFTQLRFYCSKQQGRTFHVKTVANSTGEAVVQYFSRQIDARPDACGSYARQAGDNSVLAGDCTSWDYVGKWGNRWGLLELYELPAFIGLPFFVHWTTAPVWDRWECDDYDFPASPGDFWKIYVR